jgi:hypothetical protein
MCQILIGRQSDSVSEPLRLQILVDRWIGERRVTSEVTPKFTIAISGDDGLKYDFPVLGAMHVPLSEYATLEVTKVIEAEKGMIAGASKMPIVGCTLLPTVGLADGAIHIQDDPLHRHSFPKAIYPCP